MNKGIDVASSIVGLVSFHHGWNIRRIKSLHIASFALCPADFPQDVYALQQQLNHFVVDASKDEELKNISTLIDLCRCLVETGRHTMYNLIERLLRFLITLPVSTASAERAFSSMKIIKTRLCNKMEDDYLANNPLVNIEGEILETYSYEDVIADFSGKKRSES